jgi:hypothetical protein
MPGGDAPAVSRANNDKAHEHSHHRFTGSDRHSLRNGLRLIHTPAFVVPAKAGTHNHRCPCQRHSGPSFASYQHLWLWIPGPRQAARPGMTGRAQDFRRHRGANAARLGVLPISVSNLPADSIQSGRGIWRGRVRPLHWSIVMGINHSPHHRQGGISGPTLWADDPPDDTFSLFDEDALRGDEAALWGEDRADDIHLLLEENARLRALLAQLSDLIRKTGISAG